MIPWLIRWLETRAAKKSHEAYQQGVRFAVHQLSKGVTPAELEVLAMNPFDRNAFDDGIIAVVNAKLTGRNLLDELP
jgi:hypothetical protein